MFREVKKNEHDNRAMWQKASTITKKLQREATSISFPNGQLSRFVIEYLRLYQLRYFENIKAYNSMQAFYEALRNKLTRIKRGWK